MAITITSLEMTELDLSYTKGHSLEVQRRVPMIQEDPASLTKWTIIKRDVKYPPPHVPHRERNNMNQYAYFSFLTYPWC